jgi:hypothetical protein
MWTRRTALKAAAVMAGAAGLQRARAAEEVGAFTPEMFGARGDGVANDSDAMAALAAAVTANGGGTVRFRRTTYLVGKQRPTGRFDDGYAFEPSKLLEFHGCTGRLRLIGNGARLKCADGLRYGVFRSDGEPAEHQAPYFGPGLATPYFHMIKIEGCSGPIEISELELDGSIGTHRIGGPYGDLGRQIPASGLALVNNRGTELVRDVHSHHHGLDGLLIDGFDGDRDAGTRSRIVRMRAEHNGRQGCSVTGGRGYDFEEGSFAHTGRAGVGSMPGAGVDIEAEAGKQVRDLRFTDCTFSDNLGCGLIADSGDSADFDVARCTFIGTTSWSVWPGKPGFRFRGCTFVGAMAHAHGDSDPARAAQFVDCRFTDDPALSPTGAVYGGTNPARPLADLSDARNVLFRHCAFLATHEAVLPWSLHAIYDSCRMKQRQRTASYPRGRYLGRTTISGDSNITGSEVVGEVLLNGKRFASTRV